MFGYRAEELLKKRGRERLEAQKTWPFLTESDLRSISSPADLTLLVSIRKSVSYGDANTIVQAWLQGFRARLSENSPSMSMSRPDHKYTSVPARPDW